jgi:hypothetical protein
MPATRVMTLRIEPELLEQLRAVAKAERRSVSAQMLFLVRRELGAKARPGRKRLPTLGWLSHLRAPRELKEFRRVRRSLTRELEARLRRHAKVK